MAHLFCIFGKFEQCPQRLLLRNVHDRSRQKRASVFTKSNSCPASSMTEPSGTMPILQESEICYFDFDPCEYLMNSTGGGAISTIHVAPEGRFSCARFEASGYDVKALNLERLIERVLTGFQSMEFSATIHSDKHMDVGSVKEPVVADGYYLELGKEELCGARGKRIGLRETSIPIASTFSSHQCNRNSSRSQPILSNQSDRPNWKLQDDRRTATAQYI
ncbi:hypothetical protein Cgig2_027423 [Carnegiea gigantea]|uniref:Uncharacterized protein n=1 Tax=Carnegiea gigantea TaxID=171969 RepID=A0A9Q1GWL5_9CARY|nr:hypothetical protein Cgig2_027423 [Carnegiea gigantea]